jgi:hypothetical protein
VSDLDQQPWDKVRQELCGPGPVSPAVQMRMFLGYARERQWSFEFAWRWSYERIKWNHDTNHRLEWKSILGASDDDPSRMPTRQRAIWRAAYEQTPVTRQESAPGRLVNA